MSRTSKKPNKQLSRSIRLRKYESAYESCLKTLDKKDKHKKPSEESSKDKKVKVKEKEKGSRKKEKEKGSREKGKEKSSRKKEKEKISKSKDRKRPLNDYQKFVREESKKSKYQGMSSSERMLLISKVWKTKKLK
jgi:hypothetical protein